MLLILAAIIVTVTGEDTDKYCSLCQPGPGSFDTANHTKCIYQGIGPACEDALDGGVTAEERQLILDVHNRLRSTVAGGDEKRGLPADVPQPPAANMMALNWDEELAEIAQLWANQCTFQHDCRHVEDFKVGQNIAQYWNDFAPVIQWQEIIEGWYDEVGNWSASDTPKFKFTGMELITAHYTQVVWAKTRFVGCGRHGFRNKEFYVEYYVCNYGPMGNFWDEPVYISGDPCTLCPEDSECMDSDVLCVAGGGNRTDIYAYRYQHESKEYNVPHVEETNATAGLEDNEVNSFGSELSDKALWKKWISYVIWDNTQP